MALNDGSVLINADIAAALGNLGLGVTVLGKKTADVLTGFPQRASSGQHQELDHVPGIVLKALHRQQVMPGNRQVDRFQDGPSFSLMFSTARP